MLSVLLSGFPISPADLPWWGWLLGSAFVAGIGYVVLLLFDVLYSASTGKAIRINDASARVIIGVFGLSALFLFLIGLIRFVKWVWYS